MEIKIQCGCGTKYKFDIEPVNGRMPVAVTCPGCGASGVTDANQQIAQQQGASAPVAPPPPPPAPPVAGGLRIGTSTHAAPAPSTAYGADDGRPLLQRTTFFIKEHTGFLKLTDAYDILSPTTGQKIGIAKEEPPVWAKWLRLAIKKHRMPTAINIYEDENQPPVLSIKRGFTFIRTKIRVFAGDGRALGFFRSKLISIGGGFHVFDHAEQQVAEVKGNWKGWDFRFLNKSGREIGTVTKKWSGLGKELFTSADNYIISLSDTGDANSDTVSLLLAAGLAIDIVYKEHD
ncbi:MAG: phospholipid scramblase-related protein [Verrucomicrobiota bacterium]